ncbi:uncharacterized protein LOC111012281 isoform X3 [Momordica charantia]|uniref:Uncharacterized protein LOC111012281 isoform X3 n=1 Tax=Momordica charantia TaxID=3673 RepID=A0A6J1CL28_MOMCH|nr:uncharacterized protein LOC111012281 isoform X3 [Momordica charantia]
MELADNPKSVIPSGEVYGLEKSMDSGKILISDQTNRFQNETKPESFVIDMDGFSNGTSKEISQNSRITRNFSRKGALRGGNKIAQDHAADDTDSHTVESISPLGGAVCGSATLEKQAVGLGSREELGGGSGGGGERLSFRRNSFKRSPQPCNWYLDPRKIFLLCATLSCVGTMLLIYLAFSSGMLSVEEGEFDS